jgi:hypothetical protein
MKMYYFSTAKHAHDIEFRSARCKNEIARYERDGKEAPDALVKLSERLEEIRDYMAGACGMAIQLPANLYKLAVETIGWAASMRA